MAGAPSLSDDRGRGSGAGAQMDRRGQGGGAGGSSGGRLLQGLAVLDWPPVWTAAAVALAWVSGALIPWNILGGPGRGLGVTLALAGLGLMAAAVWEMRRARTTIIPRRDPQALVTTGVFGFSRNPVYLGDVAVVAGALLWFRAPWALPLTVVFAWVLDTRFIRDEEARLTARFGAAYRDWAARVGRWLGPGRQDG